MLAAVTAVAIAPLLRASLVRIVATIRCASACARICHWLWLNLVVVDILMIDVTKIGRSRHCRIEYDGEAEVNKVDKKMIVVEFGWVSNVVITILYQSIH